MFRTGQFHYSKQQGDTLVAEASSLGLRPGPFPSEVLVASDRTGVIRRYVQDREAAIRHEFWDGEQMQYVATDAVERARKLVIIND